MDTPIHGDTTTTDPGLKAWIDAKKAKGEWLSDEDYAKKKGVTTPAKPGFSNFSKPGYSR